MPAFRKPNLLIGKNVTDFEELAEQAANNNYSAVDIAMPDCRFRGTLIKKSAKGFKLMSWQRNVSRIQNLDLSFPTIITLELDQDCVIRSADLHNSFRGSMGLLCQYQYLLDNLRMNYINEKMDERFFKKIQMGILHCFRFVEIIGAILSCLQILQEKNLDYLFEEEVTDAYLEGNDLLIVGMQRMSSVKDPISYALVLRSGIDKFQINEKGAVYAENPFFPEFYVDDKKVFAKELDGMNEKVWDSIIKSLSWEGLNAIKTVFTQDISNSFMCSNLFPSAFTGLFVQTVAAKLYNHDYGLVHHYVRGGRRFGNIPRCIGGIESLEEARQYFPRYNLDPLYFGNRPDAIPQ